MRTRSAGEEEKERACCDFAEVATCGLALATAAVSLLSSQQPQPKPQVEWPVNDVTQSVAVAKL